jgi:rod shape determining protein RodA
MSFDDAPRWLRLLLRSDWLLTLAVLSLIGVGIAFIYSAGFQRADSPVSEFYQRQMIWACVGLVGYLALAAFDYRRLADTAWWIYAGALVLLLAVLAFGTTVYGASRWLKLFGVQIQPSEFAKLALVLALARVLAQPGLDVARPRWVLLAFAIAAVPFLLIAQQPDLGTAAVLLPTTLLMLFVAGMRWKHIGVLLVLGLLSLPLVWLALDDYQQERIMTFVDPGRDPYGAGWNKMQSEIAVGSGGLAGKGYLNGTQNVLGYLPRTVAPTDFIYSVIAEEKGFVGSVTVLALYGMVMGAGMRTALVSRDRLGRLMAVGIVGMIFAHVFVNIAMTIGLMPITGLPLPLMSYGGSFMASMMLCFGILQSIYIRRERRA